MRKEIIIGGLYVNPDMGYFVRVVRPHFSDFEVEQFDLDENGNEVNKNYVIMSAHDIRKCNFAN